jgi:hypothetical protein
LSSLYTFLIFQVLKKIDFLNSLIILFPIRFQVGMLYTYEVVCLYDDQVVEYSESIYNSNPESFIVEKDIAQTISNNFIHKNNLIEKNMILLIENWNGWMAFLCDNGKVFSFKSIRHENIKICGNIMILRRDDKMSNFSIPSHIKILFINSLSQSQFKILSNGIPEHVKTIGYFGDETFFLNNLPFGLKNFISRTKYNCKLPFNCMVTKIE